MKFVLELNKKEIEAMRKAKGEVKKVFQKIRGSFQVKIVDDKQDNLNKQSGKKSKRK